MKHHVFLLSYQMRAFVHLKRLSLGLAMLVVPTFAVFAQGMLRMTAPPSGGAQKASVTQYIGMVQIAIAYSRPTVKTASGEDRTGKIWGGVVPWGLSDLGFAAQGQKPWSEGLKPWRGGANENTTISFSHDVLVEGQKLSAGVYGLHVIPDSTKEWTIIFSKNSSSWGSYFYTESEDALRVRVQPQTTAFRQFLTYEFPEVTNKTALVALCWEKLCIPFKVEVPNIVEYYIAAMRNELRGATGYDSRNWQQAAQYCLDNATNLEEALRWADYAINATFVGRKTFSSLSLKANILEKLGRKQEAREHRQQALPLGDMLEVHFYARQLLAQQQIPDALEVLTMNYKKHPGMFVTSFGLARGYSAAGDYTQALRYAKEALGIAKGASEKAAAENAVKKLQEGKDINK